MPPVKMLGMELTGWHKAKPAGATRDPLLSPTHSMELQAHMHAQNELK
jgi:hypothetical protein